MKDHYICKGDIIINTTQILSVESRDDVNGFAFYLFVKFIGSMSTERYSFDNIVNRDSLYNCLFRLFAKNTK